MQEVFEKIIEKLEEQKVKGFYDYNSIIGEKNVWAKAIEIVKQEADQYNNKLIETIKFGIEASDTDDEYTIGLRNGMRWCLSLIDSGRPEYENCNNGWILCSELLPAYGQTVLASVCAEDAEWKIIIACYKEEDFWLDGKIDAWHQLPHPYTKGEHDENTK